MIVQSRPTRIICLINPTKCLAGITSNPKLPDPIGFSDKKKFFEHLFDHARVQVKVNVSQALRRAALKMRMVKMG